MTSRGIALGQDLAEIHHDQPARHRNQRVDDMLDPDDRRAARVNFLDGLDQFAALVLGQSAGDLVEQQKFWLDRQRARQLQTLALQQASACAPARWLCRKVP